MNKKTKDFADMFTNRRGASLIIALALSSIIILLVVRGYGQVLTNIRNDIAARGGHIAERGANSGIKLGLAHAKNVGLGVNVGSAENPITVCMEINSDGAYTDNPLNCNGQLIEYWITSSSEDMDPPMGRYIVPPPGEGNAGENCNRLNNYNNPDHTPDENILKPCNWNKLRFGQTIEIPLYTTNADGTVNPPYLPNDLGPGMNSFTLKVRTPCEDNMYGADGYLKGPAETDWCTKGSFTGPDGRPGLDPGPVFDPTDIIVHWQILGDCTYYNSSGVEISEHGGTCAGMAVPTTGTSSNESDITIDVINSGKTTPTPYAVLGNFVDMSPNPARNLVYDLNTANLSPPPTAQTILTYLKDYTNNELQFPNTTSRTLNEPVIQLSVVSPLTTMTGQVAYIEYQLETDQPIADSFQTVHARGSFRNHQVMQKVKKQSSTSNVGFVIQN